MSVTRYDPYDLQSDMAEEDDGDYVAYSDYAELESKCDTENYIANTLIRELEAERDQLRAERGEAVRLLWEWEKQYGHDDRPPSADAREFLERQEKN